MTASGGDPLAIRELRVDDVLWAVSAAELEPSGDGTPQATVTYVWFTSGGETRVACTNHPRAEVLEWSEPQLRELWDTSLPALTL